VVINNSSRPQEIELTTTSANFSDLLNEEELSSHDGKLKLTVDKKWGRILKKK
jgi:hypothetical protein